MIGWILAGLAAATVYTAVKENGNGSNTSKTQVNKTVKIRCRNCGTELIVPDMFHIEGTCPNCHGNFIVENGIMRFKGMITVHCVSCGRDVNVPGGEYVEAKCDYCGATFNVDRGTIYRNNSTSSKTSNTEKKAEYGKGNANDNSYSETSNDGPRKRDYKELLKKIPPLGGAKAGFIHDAKKQLYDGGAFWHIDDFARHFGGSVTTYLSYNAKIKNAMTTGRIDQGIETLLEALEYARQKGDVSKYFHYRYLLGKWTNNLEDRVMIIELMSDYYLRQKAEKPPVWVIEDGGMICFDLYTHISLIDRCTENALYELSVYNDLIHFLIENTPQNMIDGILFHRGMLVFLSKDTKIQNIYYMKRNEIFSHIKQKCNNYELLKKMWEKAGYHV